MLRYAGFMQEKPKLEAKTSSVEDMEREVWAAEMGNPPKIDLHGMEKHIALSELESFLHKEMMDGTHVIKIIHGRGSGKSRLFVHDWLKKQKKLVPYFRDAQATGQIGGVTLALLERIK